MLRRRAATAYTAFCAVLRGNQPELRALPKEYLTYRGNPSYLMQKVEGELLQTLFRANRVPSENKVALSYGLARAVRKLHDTNIVHADCNPENFIVSQSMTGITVVVLDIDAGGLSTRNPPGPVYPMGSPKRLYKAPELATMGWAELFKRRLFFAPDDWAVAVLLYQLLVDYQGPFCSVRTHPNPAVSNYRPFDKASYRDPGVSWPKPWQERLLSRAMLTPAVVSLFYETFAHRFLLHKRPTALQWEEALNPTSAPSPVRHVYTLYTPSISVTRASPRRPYGEQVVSKAFLPDLPVGIEKFPTLKMSEGAFPRTDPREVPLRISAFGWREAITGIVRKLHLKRGVSGNGGGLTNAA
jgi:serine/threonine protein kinase